MKNSQLAINMIETKPFIHLFKTLRNHYVFDVNTSAIFTVDKDTYTYLKCLISGNESQTSPSADLSDKEVKNVQDWIKRAQEQGFLSGKRAKIIQHSSTPFLDFFLSHNMENLILQVTQACNLRCKYCAYSGDYKNRSHNDLMMSEETAKKAIDYFIARSSEMPRLAFGFYGGEPFLNFDLIKKLSIYIKQKARGKDYGFYITTNGTIMNEEIIRFLVDHNVNLFVSLDGPKEVHDRNRCFGSGRGSYDVVMKNMEMAREIAPEYVDKKIGFSAVFNDDVSFCLFSNFFTNYESVKDHMFIASGKSNYYLENEKGSQVDFKNLQFYDELEYETLKYMFYRARRLEREDVSRIVYNWEERNRLDMEERRRLGSEIPDYFHPSGPCVPGCNRLFVTVEGNLYPCERVSETSKICRFGSIDSGIDIVKAKEIMNIGRLTEEECKNCWAAMYCSACVASADDGKKLNKKQKLSYCKSFKNDTENKLVKYCIYKEFNLPTTKRHN